MVTWWCRMPFPQLWRRRRRRPSTPLWAPTGATRTPGHSEEWGGEGVVLRWERGFFLGFVLGGGGWSYSRRVVFVFFLKARLFASLCFACAYLLLLACLCLLACACLLVPACLCLLACAGLPCLALPCLAHWQLAGPVRWLMFPLPQPALSRNLLAIGLVPCWYKPLHSLWIRGL